MTETNPPTLRILGIFAHPDDAEFTVAGSAALWASQALRCHKSQVDPGDGQWLRDWAAEVGKAAGLAYAEAFRVMKLVDDVAR